MLTLGDVIDAVIASPGLRRRFSNVHHDIIATLNSLIAAKHLYTTKIPMGPENKILWKQRQEIGTIT